MTINEYESYLKEEATKMGIDLKTTPATLNAQKAVYILERHFLGENWYIVDPVNNEQGNAIAVREILKAFPQKRDKIRNFKDKLKKIVLKILE